VFSVYFNSENDVGVLQPLCAVYTGDRWVVCSRDAITGFIGGIKRAIINEYATPRYVTPVYIAGNKNLVPARYKCREDIAFVLEIVRRGRDIPCDQMICSDPPVVLVGKFNPGQVCSRLCQ